VLTIGLPLVAGLTLRQFTGVLAHEFGHFTQGFGMRLTFMIRSINFWFSCAVYERDVWDEFFERGARGGSAAFFISAYPAKALAWVIRCVLWVLMSIGNLVSSAMLRQMEFDADRYAARVAGSEGFEETNERIEGLALAEKGAIDKIRYANDKSRLADDFTLLIVERDMATSPEERLKGVKRLGLRKSATGWFDTHPCHKDRVASAKRENAAGIVREDEPARALFQNFDALSRRATELYYRKDLGIQYDTGHVVSTESLLAGSDDQDATLQVLTRFFQGLLNPLCPVFPEIAAEVSGSPAEVAEVLASARGRLLERAEGARGALGAYDDLNKRYIEAVRGNAVDPLYPIAAAEQLRAGLDPATFNAAVSEGVVRINLALAAARNDQADSGDPVVDALFALRGVAGDVEGLRRNFFALDAALSLSQSDNRGESLRMILGHAETTQGYLRRIYDALAAGRYPYGRSGGRATLSQYAVGRLPAANEIGAIHTTSQTALRSLYGLNLRLLGDLARRAEAFEASLGLQPLPDPPGEEGLRERLRARYKF
jgi:hypothetical protein